MNIRAILRNLVILLTLLFLTAAVSAGNGPSKTKLKVPPNSKSPVATKTEVLAALPTSGLLAQAGLDSIAIYEQTASSRVHTFSAKDARLQEDIYQDPPTFEHDFRGMANECYDVYVSDADGNPLAFGDYLTIECYFDQTYGGVGNNIDAVGLIFANGAVVWATAVATYQIGALRGHDPGGAVMETLGQPDRRWSKLGYEYSRITLDFSATPRHRLK